jgi:DMSO/TMAO reductase YedYZ molybdopterin-dependent catalytic subunit
MQRRRFLSVAGAGLASLVYGACALQQPVAPSTLEPTATLPPEPTPVPAPSATTTPEIMLESDSTPGTLWVRFIDRVRAPDPTKWRLEVKGLVDVPASFPLERLLAELPQQQRSSRMACMEGWSWRALWGGFAYDALAKLVKPLPAATHVYFACIDGYWECLPITELLREEVLFVTHMNDQPLQVQYGGPLRMIVPRLYGYRGAKTITSVEFLAAAKDSYYQASGITRGDGVIADGTDRPLDLDDQYRKHGIGEITAY